ncbi:MAG: outer membrane protein assembly factor [Rhodospirillaceae bacterium]|nr:outer membrane protein assembly factor [Rhodospirillaceae bacterium]
MDQSATACIESGRYRRWAGALPGALALALALVLVLAAAPMVGHAQDTEEAAEAEEPPGIPVELDLVLDEDSPLRSALDDTLVLVRRADDPPATPLGLLRRVTGDIDLALQALRSLGYYAGQVTATIDGRPPDAPGLVEDLRARPAGQPVAVVLAVVPGPLYVFGTLDIDMAADAPPPLPELPGDILQIAPGDPARASDILQAEARMVAALRDAGHPYADVPSRRAVVDHDQHTMDVTFSVDPGPTATFGSVTIDGADSVDGEFLAGRVPFERGAPYRPGAIDSLRQSLGDLDVFSSVRIEEAPQLNPDGTLDVSATVEERPPRFIGFGAGYATSEGIDATVYWGHRNLFGEAERLRIEATVGRLLENDFDEIEYSLEATFAKPDFLLTGQSLHLGLALLEEHPDAYGRTGLEGSALIARTYSDEISYSYGITFEASEIESDGETQRLGLVGVPLGVRFDSTDSLLDPTEGLRLDFELTPYPLALGDSEPFVRSELSASGYYDLAGDGTLVLAARSRLGSILLADLDAVPDTQRFYAGGGGSVRGFPFQGVGPVDASGDPLGGRSLVEASLELRWRFWGDFGLVPFIDAGGVFESSFPDFSGDVDVGAGLGMRYYTPIGPLRVDIATPLTGDNDDPVQLYISIGQAF